MNGAQDLGGQMGFGPIDPEKDEPLYHAAWEPRAMALTIASGAMGHWSIDESRHARESLRPADYLSSSYYEIWIKGLSTLLERHGFLSAQEMASGEVSQKPIQPKRVLKAEMVPGALAKGGPTERPATNPQRFRPGDKVRTINMNPTGHTRLPRYARAKLGTIVLVHGAHVFPDASAHGGGEQPQWLYTVEFTGPELWGRGADPTLSVSIDAWESYLEPA
jgi:nitrile hydratase